MSYVMLCLMFIMSRVCRVQCLSVQGRLWYLQDVLLLSITLLLLFSRIGNILRLSLSVCHYTMCVCLSVCLNVCISICLYVCMSMFLNICLEELVLDSQKTRFCFTLNLQGILQYPQKTIKNRVNFQFPFDIFLEALALLVIWIAKLFQPRLNVFYMF